MECFNNFDSRRDQCINGYHGRHYFEAETTWDAGHRSMSSNIDGM